MSYLSWQKREMQRKALAAPQDEEVESRGFVGTSKNLDRRIGDDTNMGCDTIGSKNWSNQLDMLSWRSKVDLSLTGVDTTVTESFFLWTGVDLLGSSVDLVSSVDTIWFSVDTLSRPVDRAHWELGLVST
ncbi:hypothetical protein Taro_026456 [Colocasia esculenta]|uniref:Uncharacterized protein n=1 Tax=Colocasia esculenta TaxID=4460 RepID=A0A843VH67_COLES|nr:hypothetical protein [Colocasia esculenta]